jgi:uncharacterized protein involved in tellurium resistance
LLNILKGFKMRKIIFVALAIIFAYSASYAKIQVSATVIKAFEQKFPKATSVKWDKENDHEFEAGFKWNGGKYAANFSDKGEWLETETTIQFNQLPEKVQQAFNKAHKNEKIKAVAKIENSKGEIKYEIELKKGKKPVELFYKPDGTEIKN